MGSVCEAGGALVTLGGWCVFPSVKKCDLRQQDRCQTGHQWRDGGKAMLCVSFNSDEWVVPCDWSLQLAPPPLWRGRAEVAGSVATEGGAGIPALDDRYPLTWSSEQVEVALEAWAAENF